MILEKMSVITLLSTWPKQGSRLRFIDGRERGRFRPEFRATKLDLKIRVFPL